MNDLGLSVCTRANPQAQSYEIDDNDDGTRIKDILTRKEMA